MRVVGVVRRDVHLGLDVAGARRIDGWPACLPGRRERVFELAAEGKVLCFQVNVDFERIVAIERAWAPSPALTTLPLALIFAWPFPPPMFLNTQLSGWISSRPFRLRIGYGNRSQVISHRSVKSISASILIRPSGWSRRPGIGLAEHLGVGFDHPAGIELIDDLANVGGIAFLRASSISD